MFPITLPTEKQTNSLVEVIKLSNMDFRPICYLAVFDKHEECN